MEDSATASWLSNPNDLTGRQHFDSSEPSQQTLQVDVRSTLPPGQTVPPASETASTLDVAVAFVPLPPLALSRPVGRSPRGGSASVPSPMSLPAVTPAPMPVPAPVPAPSCGGDQTVSFGGAPPVVPPTPVASVGPAGPPLLRAEVLNTPSSGEIQSRMISRPLAGYSDYRSGRLWWQHPRVWGPALAMVGLVAFVAMFPDHDLELETADPVFGAADSAETDEELGSEVVAPASITTTTSAFVVTTNLASLPSSSVASTPPPFESLPPVNKTPAKPSVSATTVPSTLVAEPETVPETETVPTLSVTTEVPKTSALKVDAAQVAAEEAPAIEMLSDEVPAGGVAPGGCDPNYSGACVPVGTEVYCAEGSVNGAGAVSGRVQVTGTDVRGLDHDGDGWACGNG